MRVIDLFRSDWETLLMALTSREKFNDWLGDRVLTTRENIIESFEVLLGDFSGDSTFSTPI